MDGTIEPITDAEERAAVRSQARRIVIQGTLATLVMAVVLWFVGWG